MCSTDQARSLTTGLSARGAELRRAMGVGAVNQPTLYLCMYTCVRSERQYSIGYRRKDRAPSHQQLLCTLHPSASLRRDHAFSGQTGMGCASVEKT